jgi:hypothetical protein
MAEVECRTHGLAKAYRHGERLRCQPCEVIRVSERRRRVKRELVELAGGECSTCGYNRSMAALQFHHVDPATKSFNIAARGHCYSRKRLMEEVEKCILLCANCHAELSA